MKTGEGQPEIARNSREFTPHSRLLQQGSVDGRSREGRFLATVRHELVKVLGRSPTPGENTIIQRICWVRLHIALIDERVAQGAVLSAHDMRSYTAYTSTLIALMRQLRLLGEVKPAVPQKPDAGAYLEALRAKAAAAP